MDVTLEMVEQLRKRANVSYEEARAVLEETGGDLLEALILLEHRGKVRPDGGQSARYSTRPGSEQAAPPPNQGPARPEPAAGGSGWEAFVGFVRRCVTNRFEVWRWGEPIVSIPLLIFILLVLLAFWISLPLLIVGLIMGCRYRFAGPDLDGNEVSQAVNHAADTVSDAVGRARAQAEQAAHKKQSKQ